MNTFFTNLSKLWDRTVTRRSAFALALFLISVVTSFGVPHVAHAAENCLAAGGVGDILGCLSDASFGRLFEAIGLTILMIANLIIFLVGSLFNEIIIYTVFQFGDYFGNSAGLLAGWSVLRDFANIVLIFGFVMLGVATILDIHGYEVKKTLPRLIIFAILLNFSLLASEAIIDTSNAFASLLYTQASQTCTGGTQQQCSESGSGGGISGAVFQLSGVASAFSTESVPNDPAYNDHTHNGIAYIGMAIFVSVLSVVLLAGSVMLITRGIVLAFLMVLSPLGFAGLAVPPLEKYAMMWWDKLLSQAFFAPLYLLLILIGLKVAQGLTGQNVDLMVALIKGQTTAIGSVVIFSILVGFMVAALIAAKQLGAVGAQFATGMATTAVSWPFAVLGRNTTGRLAAGTAKRFQSWVGNANKGGLSKGVAAALRVTGGDQAIFGGLKSVSGAKIGGHNSFDEQEKIDREFASHSKHVAEAAELKEALADNNEKLATEIAQKMSLSTIKETINSCSEAQLQMLGRVLSADTYDKVMNDKDTSPEAQHALGHGRFGSFDGLKAVDIEKMKPDDQKALQKRLRDLGTKDAELLSKYNSSLFAEIAKASNSDMESFFNDEQNEFLAKSNNVSKEVRQFAKQNSRSGRVELWMDTGKEGDAVALFNNMTAEDKMKVKASVIAGSDELLTTFHSPDINAALVKSKFNKDQLAKLKANLERRPEAERREIDAFFSKDTSLQAGLMGGWTPLP